MSFFAVFVPVVLAAQEGELTKIKEQELEEVRERISDLKENMEIISGELEVQLPGNDEWKRVSGPAEFEVPASSKFRMKVLAMTDYCCSFIKE